MLVPASLYPTALGISLK